VAENPGAEHLPSSWPMRSSTTSMR